MRVNHDTTTRATYLFCHLQLFAGWPLDQHYRNSGKISQYGTDELRQLYIY
jgi:hypothetical protein